MDLANFAQQLDEEEKATMAEGGLTNPEFIKFMQVTRLILECTVPLCYQTVNKHCRFKGYLLVYVYKARGIASKYTCLCMNGVIQLTSLLFLIFD